MLSNDAKSTNNFAKFTLQYEPLYASRPMTFVMLNVDATDFIRLYRLASALHRLRDEDIGEENKRFFTRGSFLLRRQRFV